MRICDWRVTAGSLALLMGILGAMPAAEAATDAGSLPGLVAVKSERFDEVFLRPGADFRGYVKVMLDPVQAAFAPGWLKDMNARPIALMQRTTDEDAERIAEAARTGLRDAFAYRFRNRGYQMVAMPGIDVLRLSLRIADLHVNAPESVTMTLPGRVYTLDAGTATLIVEARNAASGVLLWHVADRGTAGDRGPFRSSLMVTSPVSNRFDFGALFDTWAQDCVESLAELKQRSPVAGAAPLRP